MNKELKFAFNAPLNAADTEMHSYGCRANNSDIFDNNGISDISAFESKNCIRKKLSRTLEKQYLKIKEGME